MVASLFKCFAVFLVIAEVLVVIKYCIKVCFTIINTFLKFYNIVIFI